jgi:tripartite-type tricarboxylate transporter receptor subunit TctC
LVDWAIPVPDTSVPQMRAGYIKIFGVAAPRRLLTAPEIPTVDEGGLPGFYVSYWHGLWAAAGTPKEIVARINSALVDALADAGCVNALLKLARKSSRATSRIRRRLPLAEGGNREMVADHQGGRDQGRVNAISWGRP